MVYFNGPQTIFIVDSLYEHPVLTPHSAQSSVPRSRTMESGGDAEDVPIETFVETFAKLSRRGRRLAIQKLVSTLDSDEMDMVIEAIDTKIDDVAVQHEAEESRHHTLESESLEDSGVSSISPSETNFDQVSCVYA